MSRSIVRSKARIFFMEVPSFLRAYLSTPYMTQQKEEKFPFKRKGTTGFMQISAHPTYTGSLLQRNRPDPPLMSSGIARGALPAMMIPVFPSSPHPWNGHLPDFVRTAIDCSREWSRTQYPFWLFSGLKIRPASQPSGFLRCGFMLPSPRTGQGKS